LESKLEQLKTKLRSTKEELKECQAELTQAKAVATKPSKSAVRGQMPAKTSRKRAAVEMDNDAAIGTPDGGVVRGKRQGAKHGRPDQTMVGEKSMFSITPFLNRTMSMAPDTPDEEDDAEKDKEEPVHEAPKRQKPANLAEPMADEASPIPAPKPRGRKKAGQKPKKTEKPVLGEIKANAKAKKDPPKAKNVVSTLEKVMEEEGDENGVAVHGHPAPRPSVDNESSNQVAAKVSKLPAVEEAGAKKKKRKLLGEGKTLFDEEDGEVSKRPAKINLGAPRLLAKGCLAGPKGGLKGGLATASGFGGFSPLKKDRRGVGASFLG